jgi:hypothetical protein
MHDIVCPHCQKIFKVDETGFASILKQVRDHQFEEELKERTNIAIRERENAIKLLESNFHNKLQQEINNKREELSKKETEIVILKTKYEKYSAEKIQVKESEIAELKNKLTNAEKDKDYAIKDAVALATKERDELKLMLQHKDSQHRLQEIAIKNNHAIEIKSKEDQIERLRDMKLKLSTKLVGETLEQHCEIEFEKLRSTAFPKAYFQKDNDSKLGSKGDFIYREFDEQGVELISIMFEMKNENDETATKKTNESFLKELDKDRTEKKCEYAVLVSMLEQGNDLYDTGIVDKSHQYEKMYVVRPQFFIPIISLLRNAALNSLKYKAELALIKAQNVDIVNFENELNEFRDSFGRNYRIASEKFRLAIENIDKSIEQLKKTKENLISSENNLRIANKKAEELSIKKLAKGGKLLLD